MEDLVLNNPLSHRHLIFSAICQLFPLEMSRRVCHYSTRPIPTHEKIEKVHIFKDESPTHDADFLVSKSGQMYLVEGTVRNKVSENTEKVKGLIRAVPKITKPTAEAREKAIYNALTQILETLSRLEGEVRGLNQIIHPPTPTVYPMGQDWTMQPIKIPTLPPPIETDESTIMEPVEAPTT